MCDEYDRTEDLTDEVHKFFAEHRRAKQEARKAWKQVSRRRHALAESCEILADWLETAWILKLGSRAKDPFVSTAIGLVNFTTVAARILYQHVPEYKKRADRAPRPPKKGTVSRVLWDTSRKYMEDNIASAARKREMLFALRERHPIKFDWDVKLPDIPEKLTLPHADGSG